MVAHSQIQFSYNIRLTVVFGEAKIYLLPDASIKRATTAVSVKITNINFHR